jgi:hypothetical protein
MTARFRWTQPVLIGATLVIAKNGLGIFPSERDPLPTQAQLNALVNDTPRIGGSIRGALTVPIDFSLAPVTPSLVTSLLSRGIPGGYDMIKTIQTIVFVAIFSEIPTLISPNDTIVGTIVFYLMTALLGAALSSCSLPRQVRSRSRVGAVRKSMMGPVR